MLKIECKGKNRFINLNNVTHVVLNVLDQIEFFYTNSCSTISNIETFQDIKKIFENLENLGFVVFDKVAINPNKITQITFCEKDFYILLDCVIELNPTNLRFTYEYVEKIAFLCES